ncbi:unnamed protein product [Lactuca virosa]|uniref:Uncharacterized protein n=1 Tax=Lactuca virosa TaxID=75947 RepID=A0AAU9PCB8_9ASTR|nr:unnamed protein product [Lactuca virosa]
MTQVPLESDEDVEKVVNDAISFTDGNLTPSNVHKSSATSPVKTSTDLKRNLHDVYDVDDDGDASSTKSKRKSLGEETPLLVPKVEK